MALLSGYPGASDDAGDFISGTVWNAALHTAIKTSVEDNIHSAGNPTIKTKDIIDEVVTARGSLSSLNARLSVLTNNDGTIKTPSGLITLAQYQDILGSSNLARNAYLRHWSGGAATVPDSFAVSGAGAAVARTGTAESDTFNFGGGPYAVKLTYGSAVAKLTQTVITNFSDYLTLLKTRKFSVGLYAKSSVASQVSLVVDDGVNTTRCGASGNGTYHSGSGNAELLYGTHTIAATATKLEIYLEVANAGAGYFGGGFNWGFYDSAPLGLNPFGQAALSEMAYTRDLVRPGRLFYSNSVTANLNGADTDLTTWEYAPSVLDLDGRVLHVMASGTFAANANIKTVKFKMGADSVTIFSRAENNLTWIAEAWVIRTGAATQLVRGTLMDSGSNFGMVAAAFTRTLSAGQTVRFAGTGTATNDITQDWMLVELI